MRVAHPYLGGATLEFPAPAGTEENRRIVEEALPRWNEERIRNGLQPFATYEDAMAALLSQRAKFKASSYGKDPLASAVFNPGADRPDVSIAQHVEPDSKGFLETGFRELTDLFFDKESSAGWKIFGVVLTGIMMVTVIGAVSRVAGGSK